MFLFSSATERERERERERDVFLFSFSDPEYFVLSMVPISSVLLALIMSLYSSRTEEDIFLPAQMDWCLCLCVCLSVCVGCRGCLCISVRMCI